MLEIIPKLFTYIFVLLIYLFIIKIIKMINTDIAVMSRKKSGDIAASTYLKLLNLRQSLDFPVFESYNISKDTIIGRDKRCDISIDDPFLSQRHSEILFREGVYYLSDLDSTNGTYLNGNKITGDPIELLNGDKIEIGQLKFIFVTDGQGEGVGDDE